MIRKPFQSKLLPHLDFIRECRAQHLSYQLEQTLARMRALGHSLSVAPDGFEFMVRHGFSDEYGARKLLGLINDCIEGAVSAALRAGVPTSGILLEQKNGQGLCVCALATNAA